MPNSEIILTEMVRIISEFGIRGFQRGFPFGTRFCLQSLVCYTFPSDWNKNGTGRTSAIVADMRSVLFFESAVAHYFSIQKNNDATKKVGRYISPRVVSSTACRHYPTSAFASPASNALVLG